MPAEEEGDLELLVAHAELATEQPVEPAEPVELAELAELVEPAGAVVRPEVLSKY